MISDESLKKIGFEKSADRLEKEKADRETMQKNKIPWGIPFLDTLVGSIFPSDLILLGGRSGVGKTEMAYAVAQSAAKNGKRAHVFALEAEEGEFERRQKYRYLSYRYRQAGGVTPTNYLDWIEGKFPFLDVYEADADEHVRRNAQAATFYRKNDFDLNEFTKRFEALAGSSDLIVVDHLHYFHVPDDGKENSEFTKIITRTRDMALLSKVPVIMLVHLRKKNFQDKKIIPDLEDVQGSSNIFKVATKVITLAPGGLDENNMPVTYVRASKHRLAGERTNVVCKLTFDTTRNTYDESVQYGYLSDNQQDFVPIDGERVKAPHWLKLD